MINYAHASHVCFSMQFVCSEASGSRKDFNIDLWHGRPSTSTHWNSLYIYAIAMRVLLFYLVLTCLCSFENTIDTLVVMYRESNLNYCIANCPIWYAFTVQFSGKYAILFLSYSLNKLSSLLINVPKRHFILCIRISLVPCIIKLFNNSTHTLIWHPI